MTEGHGHGRVAEFDDHKGYGWIEDSGGRRLFFHCTAIADGSRTIEVGAAVAYQTVDGRMGPEATNITPKDQPD